MSEAAAFASEAVFDEVFEVFASSFSDSTATVGAAGVSDSFCSGEENAFSFHSHVFAVR